MIAVVLVTYNSAGVLDGCLRSLPDGAQGVTLTDIVVADNASTDDSLGIAMASTVAVQIVQLGHNAGYAAGFNAGVAVLDPGRLDAVFLLNPDCRLRPGCLAILAAALRSRTGESPRPACSTQTARCSRRYAGCPPSAGHWPKR